MSDDTKVQIDTEIDSVWWILIPSNATCCSESMTETLDLCEELFNAFGSFVVPTTIEYWILCYERETDTPFVSEQYEYIEKIEQTLQSGEGLSFADFSASIPTKTHELRHLSGIKFTQANVQIFLEDGIYSLGRFGNTEIQRFPALADPLLIWMDVLPARYDSGRYPHGHYRISIAPQTDIWFEDSERGRQNREMLESFFERLVDNMDVDRIEYEVPGSSRQVMEFD